jgi:hypothetical protein
VSSALRDSPSAMRAIATNGVCRFLDIFYKSSFSFEDTWYRKLQVVSPVLFNVYLYIY